MNNQQYIINSNSIYKKAIWAYLLLLIFEGALRKWIFPSLAQPLLLVREPIVVWLVFVGYQKGWLRSKFIKAMNIVSILSFLVTLLLGHQNIYAAIYGWRVYFFFFPFIFVVAHVMNREDILKMGRFCLYLSIPMTILIIIQFYSPQSAWVNRGVGNSIEGAGFSGALGYFRPPGTFTFISGFTCFQLLVACFLFYFISANKLIVKYKIKPVILWIIFACYLVTIPFSISRTHFFQTIVVVIFFIIGLLYMGKANKVFKLVFFGIIISLIISSFSLSSDGMDAFLSRFDSASQSEGGVSGTIGTRYFGSILDAYYVTENSFWGYGLGYGSNVGAKLLGFENMYESFNSDKEWVRVFGESGLILGGLLMIIRLAFSFLVFVKAYKKLRNYKDLMPWLFASGLGMIFTMGQLNSTSNLGFSVLISGLALASSKRFNKLKKE
jgi:hypothetical protein